MTTADVRSYTLSSDRDDTDAVNNVSVSLPFDPLQMLFGNNAAYHDIHHQQFGIKKNFSQPYFTHWDSILSTRMTPEQVPERHREKYRAGPVKRVAEKLRAAVVDAVPAASAPLKEE